MGKCSKDYNARNNNIDATKVIYIAKMKTTIQLFTISSLSIWFNNIKYAYFNYWRYISDNFNINNFI